ncbi:hypothetical protein HanIR_Chr10g0491791 [Helianthus annuus]|nr:hypothetical protein HanIR_Chr10g0491791 [Helianthus annuus]
MLLLSAWYSSRNPATTNITRSFSFTGSPILAKASAYSCARSRLVQEPTRVHVMC